MKAAPAHPSSFDGVRTLGNGGQHSAVQLVAVGDHHEGRVIPMRHGALLGRAPDIAGCIDVEDVSRHHARLLLDEVDGTWSIEDLASRNGTWVNGARVLHRSPLQGGDIVRLGARATFKVAAYDPIEGELRERQRLELVGRISAGFIHDFNNMLGAGVANIDYVRSLPAAERCEQHVEEALEDTSIALQRAAELATRLLHAGRPDEGERRAFDVSRVCTEVATMLRRVIPLTIRFDVRVAPRLHALGFAGALQQVLVNLCLNARDAMPGGGTLTIDAASVDGPDPSAEWILIRVGDTGSGMDDETRRRIFEPFFTTKRGGRGFGLGLAMSADIVSEHGGRIEVESQLRRGSTFSVHLPAARRSAAQTAANLVRVGGSIDGGGAAILVIDDQEAVRRALRRLLERSHFQVLEAQDGLSALGLLAACSSKPRLALVDFDMPGMNGIETCRALREMLPELRTVLMSGGEVDRALLEAPGAAIGLRLRKPIEASMLLDAVSKGLAGRPTSA